MSRLYVKCFLLRKNIFCQKVIEILSSIGIDVERVVLRTLVAALTILQLTCSIRKVFAWKLLLSGKFSHFLNLPHCSIRMIIWIFFLILVVWCCLVLRFINCHISKERDGNAVEVDFLLRFSLHRIKRRLDKRMRREGAS